MNRTELVAAVADRTDLTHAVVEQVLDALDAELLHQAGSTAEVSWSGLFTMDVVERAARTGRNPQTGAELAIPASLQVRLRPGARLKRAVRPER